MPQLAGMHQTTIRFSSDVWRELESAARGSGVSAAQFVRDATVARLAQLASRDLHLASAPPALGRDSVDDVAMGEAARRAGAARHGSNAALEGSQAVWAQARLARIRARSTRLDVERVRVERRMQDG